MAHFHDFEPYAYGDPEPGVVHIGWLSNKREYTKGPVDPWFVTGMKILVALGNAAPARYFGAHKCELCTCPYIEHPSSSSEIRVKLGGVTYAAPALIVHYIEAHGYQPQHIFLGAVGGATTNHTRFNNLPGMDGAG